MGTWSFCESDSREATGRAVRLGRAGQEGYLVNSVSHSQFLFEDTKFVFWVARDNLPHKLKESPCIEWWREGPGESIVNAGCLGRVFLTTSIWACLGNPAKRNGLKPQIRYILKTVSLERIGTYNFWRHYEYSCAGTYMNWMGTYRSV